MRKELQAVVDSLLAGSAPGSELSIDQIGTALGAVSVGSGDIEEIFDALEAAKRTVTAPQGGQGESHLKGVLGAARALRQELGRTPSKAEIAARSQLTEQQVHLALELAKIIQR